MNEGAAEAELQVQDWHPRLQALYRYWLSIHPPGGGLPSRRDFDPMAVREQLPTIWLVDVVREPSLRFRYRLVGTRIRDANGRELTGRWLDEAHPEVMERNGFLRFKSAANDGRPSWRRGEPTLFLAHQDFQTIENVFLPLASDGRTVDLILCATIFYRHDGSEA